MVARVGHVGIVVDDVDAMVEFLEAAFGLQLRHRFRRSGEFPSGVTGIPGVDMEVAIVGSDEQPHVLELLKYHSHPAASAEQASNRPNANHVMFEVDDAAATHAAVVEAGGKPFSEPLLAPNGAKSVFYGHDPEGGVFEVIQVLDSDNAYPSSAD